MKTLNDFDYTQDDVLSFDTEKGWIKTICNPAQGIFRFEVILFRPGKTDARQEFPLDRFKDALDFYNSKG